MRFPTRRASARSGDAPIVAVLDRGLFVRERVFVPLWVSMLQSLAAGAWRLLVGIVRFVVRYPIPTGVTLAEIVLWRRAGWPVLLGADLAVAGLLTLWAWRWPGSFRRWVAVPLRSWWRFRRTYRPRWRSLMAGCGLLETHDDIEVMPQIADLRARPGRDDLILTLAHGQIPGDVIASCEALAHGLGAWKVTARTLSPGRVGLLVLWSDPLLDPIHPDDVPVTDPGADSTDGPNDPDDNPWTRRARLTAGHVLDRLRAVLVGATEGGSPWTLPLLPGRHLLVAGTTGSGKSGLLWAILWQLRDLIGDGWVTVTALDPKFIELRAVATTGLGEVVTDVSAMPAVLEGLVAELNTRCEQITGRAHVPSRTSPIRVVIVDELATLTALSDNKSRAKVEQALGHLLSRGRAAGFLLILTSVEATKEVVRWRGLCSTRVCYRTDDDQADLVLGDGAHDNGAHTELIPEESPGVAYTRTEGRAGITRVRTLHITDDHLDTLTRSTAASTTGAAVATPPTVTSPPAGDSRVITLPTSTNPRRSAS